jgi:hypothetical protein
VSRRAYYVPKQGESFENSSNRVGVQSSAVRGGTEYAVLWYGSDGWWSNGEIRFANNQPNGKAALYNDSNNFNIGGVTHVHGAGRGAEGRVAVFAGPALNSNGVHYESGNDADNAWVVESAGNKQSISGGKFGRTDQGGELLVRKQARPTVTGVVFMAEDLDYDNLYDMVRVQGKSAGVTLAGCDMRFGGSDNEAGDNYPRYAINRDKQTRPVIVTGCLLAGRTAPWNREPTTQGQNVWDNGTDMVALAATDSAEVIPSPGRGNVATPPPEGVTVEDEDADNGDE